MEPNIIEIRRNKYGNHEHSPTKFIFKKQDNGKAYVYGVQTDDGTVRDLTEEDLEKCQELGFNTVPDNSLTFLKIQDLEKAISETESKVFDKENTSLQLDCFSKLYQIVKNKHLASNNNNNTNIIRQDITCTIFGF